MVYENLPKIITILQAAERMNVSRQTVYKWIKNGQIKTVKTPGGRQRILENSLIINSLENIGTEKIEYFGIENISNFEPMRQEPTGQKEKLWFEHRGGNWYWDTAGEQFLFKVGRNGTGENWAELVACKLCELLGLPHAEYKLAQYQERMGVITPSFVPHNASLILGNEILQHIITDYNGEPRYHQRKHTLSRVTIGIGDETELPIDWRKVAGIEDAISVLVGYLMFDTWIANTDRHHENWGLIQDLNDNHFHLAPTFDHASSLGSHEKDDNKLIRLTTKDDNQKVGAYVVRAKSALYLKQTDKNPMLTIDAFREAAKIRKNAARIWLTQLENINNKDLTRIFEKVPEEVMSSISKQFAASILEENRHRLLQVEI
jgi:excisionase family DNA binding protein